jgi:hypothetical protein
MSGFASAIILWIARILAVLILGFWGFMIIAHLVGDAGAPSRALNLQDYAGISAMFGSLLGLGLTFKWERMGAMVTLTAIAIGTTLNWRVLLFPGILIPINAVLFLLHSYLRHSESRRHDMARRL